MSMFGRLLRQAFVRVESEAGLTVADAASLLTQARSGLQSGDFDRARTLCSRILEHEPRNARALHLSGVILAQCGDYSAARLSLEDALKEDAECADAWADHGNVLRLMNASDEALASYARALRIDPRHVVATCGRSQLLAQMGREQEAIDCLQERIAPEYDPRLLREAVRLLCRHKQFDAASLLCRQALARDPGNVEAHAGSGYLALVMHHDPALALKYFDRAQAALPADADLLSNRGIALQQLGKLDEAIACYDRAIEIDPRHRAGRIHRSLALLLTGDYARGWEDYEYRRLAEDWGGPPLAVTEWQGEDLQGKSIYVYAEQGIGDEILFASCIPDLVRRSSRVVLECDPRLVTIFARSFPEVAVHSRGQRFSGVHSPVAVGAQFMIPIGSLPRYLRAHAQSFSARSGYLRADEGMVASVRARLAALPGRLRIGISWRGGTAQTGSEDRSMHLEDLLPLFKVPDVGWVSVQYGDASAEIAALRDRHGIHVHQFPDIVQDYERTAALTCALDLVISVQTAVVNLCGALGRPVWVALPLNPHWRYGLNGDSMPWYASVRVVRQATRGDWKGVIAALEARLHAFARRPDDFLPISAD